MTSIHRSALEVAMERTHARKLQFEQAHPDDWDAFNGWQAMPTMVTRAEAGSGLRKARRLGRVLVEGSHRYRLIGSNTVILRPR
jgi:hypothetical protein